MQYKGNKKELLTFGYDLAGEIFTFKIWKLPELQNIHILSGTFSVSCWTSALSSNYVAFGLIDGEFKLFQYFEETTTTTTTKATSSSSSQSSKDYPNVLIEISRLEEQHDATILSISFYDDKKLIGTCAADTSVMFWDYQKRYLKTLIFN
jgi:WD40 repeat protein